MEEAAKSAVNTESASSKVRQESREMVTLVDISTEISRRNGL